MLSLYLFSTLHNRYWIDVLLLFCPTQFGMEINTLLSMAVLTKVMMKKPDNTVSSLSWIFTSIDKMQEHLPLSIGTPERPHFHAVFKYSRVVCYARIVCIYCGFNLTFVVVTLSFSVMQLLLG